MTKLEELKVAEAAARKAAYAYAAEAAGAYDAYATYDAYAVAARKIADAYADAYAAELKRLQGDK